MTTEMWLASTTIPNVTTTLITSTMTSSNVTDAPDDKWTMSLPMLVCGILLLCSMSIISIVSNSLLIATIIHSPSLKTPPNAHLVNICINNLLLSLCMLISLFTLSASCQHSIVSHDVIAVMGGVQLFLTTLCMLQYWCVFASIGYYRCRTVKQPSMSQKIRRRVITRSITIGWLITTCLSLLLTISFAETPSIVAWNPFRCELSKKESLQLTSPNTGQYVSLYLVLLAILVGVCVLVNSYYRILKTLCINRPFCVNRVTPWTRAASLSSDENDLMLTARSYKPDDVNGWSNSVQPYTISNGCVSDNFTVHYNRRTQSLSLDEVFALENPLRAHLRHKKLQSSLSNASNTSGKSQSVPDFTDISPGAELQRFQRIKNSCALRNFSMRRDRISLSGATKNSMIMLMAFLLCSIPYFIVSVPGVLPKSSTTNIMVALFVCKLLFYLNAPVYPIWYLLFSKRVRKCLNRLYENVLIKLNLRQ